MEDYYPHRSLRTEYSPAAVQQQTNTTHLLTSFVVALASFKLAEGCSSAR